MTKTLKPVLALSVAALTLLAGCAKGEASTAWSKVKKEIKATYTVKSWDKCDFAHYDAAKAAKEVEDKDQAKKVKEAGNVVALSFTFTLKDGKEVLGAAVYGVKDKELAYGTTGSLAEAVAYAAAATVFTGYSVEAAYLTQGTLVK